MPRAPRPLVLIALLTAALPLLGARAAGFPQRGSGVPPALANIAPPLPQTRPLLRGWRFLPDVHEHFTAAALPARGWRPVQVGLGIQAEFADLRNFAGAGWYRRTLILPPLPAGDHWLLRIGACDYRCAVFLNGRRLEVHDGGYLPFRVDLSAAAHPGRNRLLIRIADPPGPVAQFQASYAQIPHGKQNWYVQTSGLWQAVELEAQPAYYLDWVHVLTRGRRLTGLRLRLTHAIRVPAAARARIAIFGPRGRLLLRAAAPLLPRSPQTIPLALRGQWWSPRHPRLYRFVVTLPDGARLAGRFGFRTIATRNGRMYLNGKLFYMRGALDQAFYPRGIYSPPSLAYLEQEMRQARALGLNTLRLHIKVPDPRYLQAADRTGMLVWYEIPNWDRLTPLSARRAKTTLQRMIARNWNHPSVILQTIVNESWGVNLRCARQRQWLGGMYRWAKAHLPNRLVDDNSACCANFHIQTDLADFHQYRSIPDHAAAWDRFVRAFAARPPWLFSPYGDAQPTGDEPLVVSEFGNWGLPFAATWRLPERQSVQNSAAEALPAPRPCQRPWWFARGFNGNPITIPGGVARRLAHSALGAVFPRYAALARATERHEWQALRYEIESLRQQPAIQGYVITELTDVNWEANGLLTMWRRPKIFAPQLAALQKPVVVLAEPSRPDNPAGSVASLRIVVSNESPSAFTGGQVSLAGQRFAVPPLASGSVQTVAYARVRLPAAPSPARPWARVQTVRFRLSQHGRTLDARALRIGVIGGQTGRGAVRLAPGGGPAWRTLAARLAAHGYQVLPAAAAGGVLLTPVWPLPPGAPASNRVLVLADSPGALAAPAPERVVARRGNLSGDWISNFNWVNPRRPPFAFLRGFDPILGREALFLTPRFLLRPPPPAFRHAELAGFFLGWVHAQHALAIQAQDGPSSLFLTTFRLAPAYGRDAMATAMLNAIIRYMRTPAFQPRWRW